METRRDGGWCDGAGQETRRRSRRWTWTDSTGLDMTRVTECLYPPVHCCWQFAAEDSFWGWVPPVWPPAGDGPRLVPTADSMEEPPTPSESRLVRPCAPGPSPDVGWARFAAISVS
jgi:hypothetical protein